MQLNPQHPVATRRNPLKRWLFRLMLWLVPLCVVWWVLGGSSAYLRVLHFISNAVLPRLVFEDIRELVWMDDMSWKIRTSLEILNSSPPKQAILFLATTTLKHIILGFPLMWALLFSTPGRWKKRVALGTILLTVLVLLCVTAHTWALMTVLINHRPSQIDASLVPPPFYVIASSYPEWQFHLSGYLHFIGILIIPIISPLLIWMLLCPRAVMRLLVSLRPRKIQIPH